MRREGYELHGQRARRSSCATVDGEVQEPYERITIDIPPDYIGEVQQALAGRKGRLEQMTTDADGRVRMEFVLPVRGLIGYRGQLLTDTRGTALLHQIGEGYGPWAGEVTHRTNGVLVADRAGTSNAYALFNLQERSELFIGAGVEVYEGMIVGENARSGDMDVNPTKEKKLTNIRTHAHDEALRLTPPRPLTLEIGDRVHRRRRAGRGDARLDPPAQAAPVTARPGARARPRRGPAPRRRARGRRRSLTATLASLSAGRQRRGPPDGCRGWPARSPFAQGRSRKGIEMAKVPADFTAPGRSMATRTVEGHRSRSSSVSAPSTASGSDSGTATWSTEEELPPLTKPFPAMKDDKRK